MRKLPLLIASHALIAVAGFAAGIYTLPILTAPSAPTTTEMAAALGQAQYTGEFRRTLAGSDFLHWGEGTVSVGPQFISLHGRVAPGPDYMLYLSPEFVETEAAFNKLKPDMVRVGNVKTFENFLVTVPGSINPEKYNTVVIWCESFGEFITAAKYR
jgi:hypothetical protein